MENREIHWMEEEWHEWNHKKVVAWHTLVHKNIINWVMKARINFWYKWKNVEENVKWKENIILLENLLFMILWMVVSFDGIQIGWVALCHLSNPPNSAPVSVRLSLSMHFHVFVNFIFILSFSCCPCKSRSIHWDHPLRSRREHWRIVREYLLLFMFATMFQFLLKWRKIFEEWFMFLWTVYVYHSIYSSYTIRARDYHWDDDLFIFLHFVISRVVWNGIFQKTVVEILLYIYIRWIYSLQYESMIFSNEIHPSCSSNLITNKLQINID